MVPKGYCMDHAGSFIIISPCCIFIQKKEVWTVFKTGESGQGLVEYALILMLVVVVVMIMVAVYGPAVGNLFSNIISNF